MAGRMDFIPEMRYMVVAVDGDYALLSPFTPDPPDGRETQRVALALLPENLREGEVLIRRLLEYERDE